MEKVAIYSQKWVEKVAIYSQKWVEKVASGGIKVLVVPFMFGFLYGGEKLGGIVENKNFVSVKKVRFWRGNRRN